MLIFQSIIARPVGLPLSVFQSTTNRPDVDISIHNGPAGGTPTVCVLINNQLAGNLQPTGRMLIFISIMDRLVGLPLSGFPSPTNRPDVDISIHNGPAGGNSK